MIPVQKCKACQQLATEFEDKLSEREYAISGLCQKCQNLFFREDEEDEECW